MLACLQVIGHHADFLRKVLKGCLLSRKLTLLQCLVQLKKHASTFTQLSAALHIDTDALAESASDLDIVPQGKAGQCTTSLVTVPHNLTGLVNSEQDVTRCSRHPI